MDANKNEVEDFLARKKAKEAENQTKMEGEFMMTFDVQLVLLRLQSHIRNEKINRRA